MERRALLVALLVLLPGCLGGGETSTTLPSATSTASPSTSTPPTATSPRSTPPEVAPSEPPLRVAAKAVGARAVDLRVVALAAPPELAVEAARAIVAAGRAEGAASLGAHEGDVLPVVFIVTMEAAKSAREDLKAIMANVKAIDPETGERRVFLDAAQATSDALDALANESLAASRAEPTRVANGTSTASARTVLARPGAGLPATSGLLYDLDGGALDVVAACGPAGAPVVELVEASTADLIARAEGGTARARLPVGATIEVRITAPSSSSAVVVCDVATTGRHPLAVSPVSDAALARAASAGEELLALFDELVRNATVVARELRAEGLDDEARFVEETVVPAAARQVNALSDVLGSPTSGATTKEIDSTVDAVKGKLESLSELGEMESLRLQMAMDRLSKLMSTLSNVLKKISETAAQITQNLK